jgi:tetratricopeptide (TPR) repeat protein
MGGHIERLVGTLMRAPHELPGATFSNPKQRGNYDSEASAALTLDELERWLTDYIVCVYHAKRHPNVAAELELIEASIACDLSELAIAHGAAERALKAYALLGEASGVARAKRMVGRVLVLLGKSEDGEPLLHEALQTAYTLADPSLTGDILECIALSRSVNADISGARAYFSQALTIYQDHQLDDGIVSAALNLGESEFVAGDSASAVRHANDALATAHALNDLPSVVNVLSNIAAYSVAQGRFDDTQTAAGEALHLAFELQLDVHVAWAAQHFAAVFALQPREEPENAWEQRKRAAQLLGFVDKRLASLDVADWYTEAQEHDRVLAVLHDTIGSDELLQLMATGAQMTQDEAVEYALSGGKPGSAQPDALE